MGGIGWIIAVVVLTGFGWYIGARWGLKQGGIEDGPISHLLGW